MDSEKQPEGFEGAGVGGWRSQVVALRRVRIAWSTGCGAKTMNTVMMKRNFKKKHGRHGEMEWKRELRETGRGGEP